MKRRSGMVKVIKAGGTPNVARVGGQKRGTFQRRVFHRKDTAALNLCVYNGNERGERRGEVSSSKQTSFPSVYFEFSICRARTV